MALFVLGAGATRGCSFVVEKRKPCVPPLDADFFTQLQKVGNQKHQKLINQVIDKGSTYTLGTHNKGEASLSDLTKTHWFTWSSIWI